MRSWTSSSGALADAVDAELERRRRRRARAAGPDPAAYRDDPAGFARDVLGLTLTAQQALVLEALRRPPYKVIVKSANNVGKTLLAAVAAVWFYLTRDPSSVVVTAPTFRQVVRILFKEIRRIYGDRPGLMPRAPHIETSPWHVLTGFTATDETSFQGLRERSNLLIFEEATGIDADIWTGANYMISGGDRAEALWLAICNPTDPGSQAYLEEQSGAWAVVSISAFEHPNILAELTGATVPIPAAVRLAQLAENLAKEGEFVPADRAEPTDVDLFDPATYGVAALPEVAREGIRRHFPGRHWRPTTPEGDARILGRYPRQSAYSVFTEALFDLAERLDVPAAVAPELPRIGCDVARFGDDCTAIHARWGRVALAHETYRGQDTAHTAGRLKALARELAQGQPFEPTRIPIHIDDDGVGGGVVDAAGGYNFIPVNASGSPRLGDDYPNVRSEVLFDLAAQLRAGRVALGRLPPAVRAELRRQAIGITYRLDAAGRRVAEPKEAIKKRLRRSPDDLDALALAYYTPPAHTLAGGAESPPKQPKDLYRRDRDRDGRDDRGREPLRRERRAFYGEH